MQQANIQPAGSAQASNARRIAARCAANHRPTTTQPPNSTQPTPSARAADSSSLDDLETSAKTASDISSVQARLHDRFQRDRWAIIEALWSGDDQDAKRAEKLRNCCATPLLAFDGKGDVRLLAMRCKQRACPLCSAQRSRDTAARAETATERMDSPRFLTLTMAHSDEPLAEQLKALRAAFRKLRAHWRWKRNVTQGIYGIEVTYNTTTDQWHPHIHAIIDGSYYEQHLLSQQWHDATGNSRIVHIKPAFSRKGIARYITKYVTKPASIASWPKRAILEWTKAMHGVRTLATIGKLHGVNLDPKPKPTNTEAFPHLVAVRTIEQQANNGSEAAMRLLVAAIIARPSLRPLFSNATVSSCFAAIKPGQTRRHLVAADVERCTDAQPPRPRPPNKATRNELHQLTFPL